MQNIVAKRLRVFQQLQSGINPDSRVRDYLSRISSLQPNTVKAIVSGKPFELQRKDSPISIIDNLKLLGGDKSALFARVRYKEDLQNCQIVDPDSHEEPDGEQDWKLQMLNEPLLGDCQLSLLSFEDQEARVAFWHSSAHVLGYAIEKVFEDPLLTIGPPVKDGFYYDFFSPSQQLVRGEEDQKALEKAVKTIVGKNYPFERLIISKEQALELFSYNPFKLELISKKVADSELTSVFKIGDFIDLCTGPHVPSTKYVQALKVMKHSQAYWLGDAQRESLQRVYGISFPTKPQLAEYLRLREEAKRRDHRVIGPNQELFFFHEQAPGSAFFLPHGSKIYNKLMEFVRTEYQKRGYEEVITPNLFNIDLWKTSGHYKNYKENLYLLAHRDGDRVETQGLKPMNCPGHCLIFRNKTHSYKELPIKLADFGVLHRNELSGALSGLTRVRRFQQDDAHIFCRRDQIEAEVLDCLEFLEHVYGLFGFEYELFLSTRPVDSLGGDELWEEAEQQLRAALERCGKGWKLNRGDGAFYGPKIDVVIHDALGRPQQCGTIQLDFQLPIRFNLQYTSATETEPSDEPLSSETTEPDEYSHEPFTWREKPLRPKAQRPVMIHRAIFGSLERFIAILIEHLGGKWPLWLSPRQAKVCSVSQAHVAYCTEIARQLKARGWEVEMDVSDSSLNKKVRTAQLQQFNYILVVGEQEQEEGTVDVRPRDGGRLGKMSLEGFEKMMVDSYPDSVPLPERLYKLK